MGVFRAADNDCRLALCDGICARVGEVRPMITALIIIAALVALLLWIDSAWWR